VRAIERGIPRDLAAIVDKAMAFDPRARCPSAFELGEDLRRFQAGQLVAARRYRTLERILCPLARPALLVAVGLFVAALGLLWP
jgi:hypothetical protein